MKAAGILFCGGGKPHPILPLKQGAQRVVACHRPNRRPGPRGVHHGPAMLRRTVHLIEGLNEAVGRVVSWLVALMVLTTFAVAVLRYGFRVGWVAMQESYVWMHATVFLVASGYTLRHDGHVRIDLIYGTLSARGKAWVNLLGVLFLLMPTLILVWWVAYPYVQLSWRRFEGSGDVGGLPGLFLLKSTILVFVVLLGLQGIALAIRSYFILRGHEDWDVRPPNNEPRV